MDCDFFNQLFVYSDDYSAEESIPLIHKQVMANVNKDNAAKIWKASLDGNVQDADASLIATMTSENIIGDSNKDQVVEAVIHIMKCLVERAKELGLEEDVYHDVQESIDFDYSGWKKMKVNSIPGNFSVTADDLGDWLEPRIDALIEAIEEAEASQ